MNQHHPLRKLTAIHAAFLDATFARNRAAFGGFRMVEDKPEDKPEPKPADKPEDKPEPKPADKPEDKPEPKPADKPQPKPAKEGTPKGYATDMEGNSLGYPANTPVAEMSHEEAAAYHRTTSRKHEQRADSWKSVAGDRTPEQLKADLARLEELERKNMTEEERKVADARKEGRGEGITKANTRLAENAFDLFLDHVPEDQRKVLIETIDLTKVVDAEGLIDTAKVKEIAGILAPRSDKDKQRDPDYGGGRRGGSSSSGVKAGASAYERRHGKKSGTDD